MIEVEGLTKAFDGRRVLKGIDLQVATGNCLAIMGPNGAGKTTLLRILAALSRPTAGRVRIAGLDPERQAREARQRIGFLSHQPLLYEGLSAEENLQFYGRMYGVRDLDQQVVALLKRVGLDLRRYDLVRTFSRGMKQRLAIARVLLHNPQVFLMDEPYTGLDEQAADMLDQLIARAGETGRTIVLTTHDAERGLRFSQQAVLLAGGQIKYRMDGTNWDPERFRQENHGRSPGMGQ